VKQMGWVFVAKEQGTLHPFYYLHRKQGIFYETRV